MLRLLSRKVFCPANKLKLRFKSQLSAAFNQIPSKHSRIKIPFVSSSSSSSGLFGKKELCSYEGFYELEKEAESRVDSLIAEAFSEDCGSKRKMVEIFDDISNELCCVADLAEFVRTSHPDDNYRQSANLIFGQISQIVEKLNTNLELYVKLKDSLDREKSRLDECDSRVCRLFLADFEQSGIHLDRSSRSKFVAINDQLVNLLMKFQINSQQPSLINVSDLDPKYKDVLKYFRDPIQVDTMYINSDDELVREFVYKSYLQENKVQESFFKSIINKRKEIAKLCGYESYSHRANINMIMDNPTKIINFLDECSKVIEQKAIEDYEKMNQFKRTILNSSQPLYQWDVPIISSRIKKSVLDLDRSQYMDYFSLGTCMEGLNLILNHVFNVNLEMEKLNPDESWHTDIYKLAVIENSNNTLLGYIYCDFYHRADKFSNVDCHFTIQCSKLRQDNTYQLPIVVLHLNFPPPSKDRPTLLSFEMMENLFHEFGHAMHSMFAKTRYQHVSGTRCSTDFAEVPSQLMEFYCRDPRILRKFAKHYATNKPLDQRIIDKLCQSKKMFTSCELQNQILNSMLDQAFHLEDLSQKPVDMIEKYTKRYHYLPYARNTHWHLRYTHLVGYGAKYYSYLVSKAIASKIWSECFEKDPLSSSAGELYRKKMLEFGGEKQPLELISSLIGLDEAGSNLVDSLTKNI